MENDPLFEKTVALPLGYVFTARARPATIKRTILRLLPWALVVALPQGRAAKIAALAANRFSPMLRQKIR